MIEKQKLQDCSEPTLIHYDVIETVRVKMPPESHIYDISDLFKVFGDSTRAKTIYALTISEMCVCDIAALLNMSSSAISHQLRILKQSRIVKNRRDGKVVYYRLADDHIKQIFNIAYGHVIEEWGNGE